MITKISCIILDNLFCAQKKTLKKNSKTVHSCIPKFSPQLKVYNQNENLYIYDNLNTFSSQNAREILKSKFKIELSDKQLVKFCDDDLGKYFLNNRFNQIRPIEIYDYITSNEDHFYNYRSTVKFKSNTNANKYFKNQISFIKEFVKDTKNDLLLQDIIKLSMNIDEIENINKNFYFLYFEHEIGKIKNDYAINHIHYDSDNNEYSVCNLIFSNSNIF